jgi:hypothetical protein
MSSVPHHDLEDQKALVRGAIVAVDDGRTAI